MTIVAAKDPWIVRALFREYAASLDVDLSFQDFERELEEIETWYEVICLECDSDGTANGCVALRRIDERTCEMKRLYVRRPARGKGLGRALALHVIAEARARGYALMRLDTLPSMAEAMKMYEALGFRDIDPYRTNPVSGARFMELALDA